MSNLERYVNGGLDCIMGKGIRRISGSSEDS